MKELTKEELKNTSAGGAYEIGKAIGKWSANFVDQWAGTFQGIYDAIK